MVLKYDLTSEDVEIIDTTAHDLTSHEKLCRMFADGHHLEAAATQVLLVEAMLLHYLLARNQADNIQYAEDPRALLQNNRLTFGRMHRLLVDANAYHDAALGERVARYVASRNELVHHLVARANRLDFDGFFTLGCELVDQLRSHAHELIRKGDGG